MAGQKGIMKITDESFEKMNPSSKQYDDQDARAALALARGS